MVVGVTDVCCFSRHIMHRNTMRPSPSVAVVAARPPKPPCWRDFVSTSKYQTQSSTTESEFTDISKLARSSNESYSSDGQIANKQGKQRRIRAKIHRTRSQFTIEENDLPEETLTVTLAETKPDDLGLRRENTYDERIFQEDNNRKCQTWLQSVEACKPLEVVVPSSDLIEPEVEGVSIEVPDDTLWYDSMEPHPPNNSSASGSECGNQGSTRLTFKALHRSKTYEPTLGHISNSSNSRSHRQNGGKHSVFHQGDKHVTTG